MLDNATQDTISNVADPEVHTNYPKIEKIFDSFFPVAIIF